METVAANENVPTSPLTLPVSHQTAITNQKANDVYRTATDTLRKYVQGLIQIKCTFPPVSKVTLTDSLTFNKFQKQRTPVFPNRKQDA